MAGKHFVKIIRFGLIGEAQDGDKFRHVLFQDTINSKKAELLIFKKKSPELWNDIEQLEQGKSVPPYKGYVTAFNGTDIVVLGDESLEEAFTKQRWKLDLQKKISRHEADRLRKETKGYITNLTHPGAIEISWREIDTEVRLIRFRYYEGQGNFSLSKWYEITDN
jgi:hypothetical protein